MNAPTFEHYLDAARYCRLRGLPLSRIAKRGLRAWAILRKNAPTPEGVEANHFEKEQPR